METTKLIAIDAFAEMYDNYIRLQMELNRNIEEIDTPSEFVFVCAGDLENMCNLFGSAECWSQLQRLGDVREEVLDWMEEEADGIITFDVIFNDDIASNCKYMRGSVAECYNYIRMYNGTDESYFADYKGGTVSIVNTLTDECAWWDYVR